MNKKVWKIFLRKKKEELFDFVKGLIAMILVIAAGFVFFAIFMGVAFVLGLIANYFGVPLPTPNEKTCNTYFCISTMSGVLVILFLGLTALVGKGIHLFCKWLKQNYDESVEEANRK